MLQTDISNKAFLDRIKTMPADSMETFLLCDGKVRVCAVNGTYLVGKMREYHRLGPVETYVLGGAYVATLLMASNGKERDRIQLSVECGGPIGGIYTESYAPGFVRGYLKSVPIELKKPLDGWDLNELYGPGFISVTRIIEGSRTPFTGQVMMQYGNLAKDIALYYAESEQIPTTLSISVNFDRGGMLLSAGGFMLQAMPGCDDETLGVLEAACEALPSLGEYLRDKGNIREYIMSGFAPFHPKHISSSSVMFYCPCSREKYAELLKGLPDSEKNDIMETGPFPLKLECLNCGSKYSFTREEVSSLFGRE